MPGAAAHSVRSDLAGTDLNALEVNVERHGTVMDPSDWTLGRQIQRSKASQGFTVMITEQRSTRLRPIARLSASRDRRPVASDRAGRLIQIALALYLIPALLVVLAVGGVGMTMLAVGRLVTGPVREPLG
jgi:hypothetical protein